jgi:hypothetical protein
MLRSQNEIILLVLLVATLTYITTSKTNVVMHVAQPDLQVQQQTPIQIHTGDDRYTRAPRPQRKWEGLESIATRGPPEAYQQMGVITGADGKVLPLYGRRTAARSDFFNYYTRTDTYNPVALPVSFKKRDCQDMIGCSEVMTGDEIKLAATGDTAKVTLYGFDTQATL